MSDLQPDGASPPQPWYQRNMPQSVAGGTAGSAKEVASDTAEAALRSAARAAMRRRVQASSQQHRENALGQSGVVVGKLVR